MTTKRLPRPCAIEQCTQMIKVGSLKEYCPTHYRRLKLYGHPLFHGFGFGDTYADRFWSKVAITANPDRCWEWQGGRFPEGYGISKSEAKQFKLAHHVSWYLTFGEYPQKGVSIMHLCDNPPCVNPKHLQAGTHQDNMTDMVSKKRNAFGERSGMAKLQNADIPNIIELVKSGLSQREVARRFDVSHTVVNGICLGKLWKHFLPEYLPESAKPQYWKCQNCEKVFRRGTQDGEPRKFCSRDCRWNHVRVTGSKTCSTFEQVSA